LFGGSEIARNVISRTPLNEMKYFASAVFFLSFSFGIWMLGKDGSEECDPESWFQAHAIWHVINAFATLLIWKHFKETLK
jgi:Na+/melibiose symporter-like transporter